MYVCNCNGITERGMKAALRAGIERWHDVHAFHDCRPRCGKCQCDIVAAIAEHADDNSGFLGGPVPEAAS